MGQQAGDRAAHVAHFNAALYRVVCGQRNGSSNPGISWFWRRVMADDVKQSAIDPASGILPPVVLRNSCYAN